MQPHDENKAETISRKAISDRARVPGLALCGDTYFWKHLLSNNADSYISFWAVTYCTDVAFWLLQLVLCLLTTVSGMAIDCTCSNFHPFKSGIVFCSARSCFRLEFCQQLQYILGHSEGSCSTTIHGTWCRRFIDRLVDRVRRKMIKVPPHPLYRFTATLGT